jgi:hypothetical protein
MPGLFLIAQSHTLSALGMQVFPGLSIVRMLTVGY